MPRKIIPSTKRNNNDDRRQGRSEYRARRGGTRENEFAENKPRTSRPGTVRVKGAGDSREVIYPFKSSPRNDYRKPAPVEAAPVEPKDPENLIMGRNAVREALRAGRSIERIWIQTPIAGPLTELYAMAREQKVVVQESDRKKLDEMTGQGLHQGIVALVSVKDYVPLDDIIAAAREKGEDPLLVALDEITDPHNLGAILRSAECAGAHGVIVTRRRSTGLTATVAKVSAGAVEYLPVARVANLSACLRDLKEQGLWVVGADMNGEDCYTCDLTGPTVLVIGSEGEGLSRLVRETCDRIVSLPMKGHIDSLNASVAAGVLMYEIARQRRGQK